MSENGHFFIESKENFFQYWQIWQTVIIYYDNREWAMTSAYQSELPAHQFKVGDCIELTGNGVELIGTLFKVQETKIIVLLNTTEDQLESMSDDALEKTMFRMDQTVNQISYKRMKKALEELKSISEFGTYFNVLLSEKKPEFKDLKVKDWKRNDLNEGQRGAVEFALSAQQAALILGPPGSGKTTVLVELIHQLLKQEKKLLICAPSNNAVDNLLERLIPFTPKETLIRIGNPSRVLNTSLDYLSDSHIQNSAYSTESQKKEMNKLLKQTQRSTFKKLEKEKKKEIWNELKMIKKEIQKQEQTAIEHLIENAKIIMSTLAGAGSSVLKGKRFDYVLIDEVGQSTEPECWIALLKAEKAILAGDHLQLPPTVLAKPVDGIWLGKSIYERLVEKYPQIQFPLTQQYRMNRLIMAYPSQYIYKTQLKAGSETVSEWTLKDLPNYKQPSEKPLEGFESEEAEGPLVFVDTSDFNYYEQEVEAEGKHALATSKFNEKEGEIIFRHCQRLLSLGIKPEEIGVITPYNAQVELIKNLLHSQTDIVADKKNKKKNEKQSENLLKQIEVHSIDGFQGREKEAILISLVRSNDSKQIGFLAEERRLNVAFTRAKRQLFVVGDSSTLKSLKFLKGFLSFCEENGEIRYPDFYFTET